MSEHREAGPTPRSLVGRAGPGSADRPLEASPSRLPDANSIRAVSDLMARKEPAFGRPAVPLPDFPRSVDETLRKLKKDPGLRAKSRAPDYSIDPPPVGLPAAGSTARPGNDDPHPGEVARSDASRSADHIAPSPTVGVPSPAAAQGAPPQAPASRPTGDGISPGIAVKPDPRIAPVVERAHRGDSSPGLDRIAEDPGRPRPQKAGEVVASPEPAVPGGPVRVAIPIGSPGSAGALGVAPMPPTQRASDGPGAPRDVGAATMSPGNAPEARPAATGRGQVATIGIRNPLSPGPRGPLMASPDLSGKGGPSPGLDAAGFGAGPGEHVAGGPASNQAGGSVDLSKTNELLRQLIDAVKHQRDSALPVGGQSAYPGR